MISQLMTTFREFILMNSKMWGKGVSIKANGIRRLGREMGSAFSYGKMDQSMRVYGKRIRQLGKAG